MKDDNKMTKHHIPDWIKKYIVTDCKTVEEFAHKYRKKDRFTQRGEDYVKVVMKTHLQELKDYGYTSISQHDNVTGETVAFIEQK